MLTTVHQVCFAEGRKASLILQHMHELLKCLSYRHAQRVHPMS
jgi:hypothetical protein